MDDIEPDELYFLINKPPLDATALSICRIHPQAEESGQRGSG